MDRFVGKFSKLFAKEPEQFDVQKHLGDPEIHKLYEFIGIAVPEVRDAGEIPIRPAPFSQCENTESDHRQSGYGTIHADLIQTYIN